MPASTTEANEALQLLERVFRGVGLAVYELDLGTGELRGNAVAREMFGLGADGAVSYEAFLAGVHPEDRERVLEAARAAGRRGSRFEAEYRIVDRTTGETRWVHDASEVILDASGKALRMVGIAQDITRQKASELALAKREAELRDHLARADYAVRLSGIGFWYCDLPFGELQWDARVKDHFFLPPEARVTIETFWDRIVPEDRAETKAVMDSSIETRRPYDVTYRTHDPATGAIKWIRALGGAAYAPDGTPIRFDGVTVDVSEQKRIEENVRQSETRLRHVLDGMTEAFGLMDRDLRIITQNRAAQQMDGRPLEAVVGRTHEEAYPNASPEIGRLYERALSEGVPVSLEHRFERAGGGGTSWLGMRAYPVPEGLAVFWQDISERKAMEAALQREHDGLQEANRAKDDFMAMLGHELRNPLAPIATAVQLLKLRGKDNVSREVGVIDRQVKHLARLVDDLLDVTRIARGKVDLDREAIELADVMAAAIETASPAIEHGRHDLSVDVVKEGLVVEADRARLTQVFANLLTNAAKYTPPNGRIRVAATKDGSEVVVSVEDDGEGIAPDLLPRLFGLFIQARQTLARSQGGLGLGLALVKNLVALHGGSVSAHSEGPGRGSVFTVRLPAAERAIREEPPSFPPSVQTSTHRRVLIVDDNVDSAEMLAALLQRTGYETATAHDGPDALEIAATCLPHLALLDIGLPVMDGYELASQLRARWPDLKLVAITGYGQTGDRQRTRAAGFHAHLNKPVDFDALRPLLEDLLAGEARAS